MIVFKIYNLFNDIFLFTFNVQSPLMIKNVSHVKMQLLFYFFKFFTLAVTGSFSMESVSAILNILADFRSLICIYTLFQRLWRNFYLSK